MQRCFLRFLLEPIRQYNQLAFIKKSEYFKNIRALFDAYFIEPFRAFNMFQIRLRHPGQFFYHFECPEYFSLYSFSLRIKKMNKIVFVKMNTDTSQLLT